MTKTRAVIIGIILGVVIQESMWWLSYAIGLMEGPRSLWAIYLMAVFFGLIYAMIIRDSRKPRKKAIW